ncbi:MAG: cupin domain-containing protein [Alphaproteobacteria bacterium]
MELNADFTERVVVHSNELAWSASPMPGVSRQMLDRIGGEVARATSVVRYDPGSRFSAHVHGGGEEFIVLDGVFQDVHGDYPAGTYVRNPPTSRHTPASAQGCTILVKLWQFDPADRTHVRIDLQRIGRIVSAGRPGVALTPLFRDHREDVRLEVWEPNADAQLAAGGGLELFVLDGGLSQGGDQLRAGSWLRSPGDDAISGTAGPDGARLWIKTGHLRFAAAPSQSSD